MKRSMLGALVAGAWLVACGPGDEVVVIDPPPAKVKEAPPPVPTDPVADKDVPPKANDPDNKEKTAQR
jgi:hypothetical protein